MVKGETVTLGRIEAILANAEKTAPYSYWEPGLWEHGLMNEFSPMRTVILPRFEK